MGRGGPSLELHSCRPPASLLALPVLGSIFLHTGMIVLGQLAALFTTMSQEWCAAPSSSGRHRSQCLKGKILIPGFCFYPRYVQLNSTRTGEENLPNMENSSVFLLSGFQYIIMAVVVTKGYPHKKPLYYNCEWTSQSPTSKPLSALMLTLLAFCCSAGIFLCLLLLLFAVMTWLVIYPGAFVAKTLQLYDFSDMEFKVLLLALAALNFFLCFIFEVSRDTKLFSYVIHGLLGKIIIIHFISIALFKVLKGAQKTHLVGYKSFVKLQANNYNRRGQMKNLDPCEWLIWSKQIFCMCPLWDRRKNCKLLRLQLFKRQNQKQKYSLQHTMSRHDMRSRHLIGLRCWCTVILPLDPHLCNPPQKAVIVTTIDHNVELLTAHQNLLKALSFFFFN